MLSDAQLDDIKEKLEEGRTLQDIVTNDYAGETLPQVRNQLISKFTQPVFQQAMMDGRLTQLTVEQLNERIAQIQARLVKVTQIRDSKL